MLEFLEKHWAFLVLVTIVGSFVIWSVKKERKEEEKKQDKNIQKNKRDIDGGFKK
jgi:uncharacterized Tic20 family protein